MYQIKKPLKVREFIKLLESQGYHTTSGKGNHKILTHPDIPGKRIVISGNPGDEKSSGFLNSLLKGTYATRNLCRG